MVSIARSVLTVTVPPDTAEIIYVPSLNLLFDKVRESPTVKYFVVSEIPERVITVDPLFPFATEALLIIAAVGWTIPTDPFE